MHWCIIPVSLYLWGWLEWGVAGCAGNPIVFWIICPTVSFACWLAGIAISSTQQLTLYNIENIRVRCVLIIVLLIVAQLPNDLWFYSSAMHIDDGCVSTVCIRVLLYPSTALLYYQGWTVLLCIMAILMLHSEWSINPVDSTSMADGQWWSTPLLMRIGQLCVVGIGGESRWDYLWVCQSVYVDIFRLLLIDCVLVWSNYLVYSSASQ